MTQAFSQFGKVKPIMREKERVTARVLKWLASVQDRVSPYWQGVIKRQYGGK